MASSTPALAQMLLAPGPLDDPASTLLQRLQAVPYAPGPATWPSPLNQIPVSVYEASLQAWVPFLFSLVYYVVAHSSRHGGASDLTKGGSLSARFLRLLVILHNALLAFYSGWTFCHMLPIVLRLFFVGYRAAGLPGMRLALCSMPTNTVTLAPYAWLFYLSKYYEVIDSVILVLKGKTVSNLQSYHHAGALLAMWIAYRYQATPVWVFVTFNAGVHTAMYTYYLCAAMKWPFPRRLKRSLTTLQIVQIMSGTIITNFYWFTPLQPINALTGLSKLGITHAVAEKSTTELLSEVLSAVSPLSGSSSLPASSSYSPGRELFEAAAARATSRLPGQCLEYAGSGLALHVNTSYMMPLIVLFARFFLRSYTKQRTSSPSSSSGPASRLRKAEMVAAEGSLKDVDKVRDDSELDGFRGKAIGSQTNGKILSDNGSKKR